MLARRERFTNRSGQDHPEPALSGLVIVDLNSGSGSSFSQRRVSINHPARIKLDTEPDGVLAAQGRKHDGNGKLAARSSPDLGHHQPPLIG